MDLGRRALAHLARPALHSARVLAGAVASLAVLTLAAVTFASAHGYAVVHRCVELPGAGAAWGMRLALVRDSAACPAGEVAVGGSPQAVVHVIGAMALSAIVAHVLALLLAAGVGASIGRAARRYRETLRRRLLLFGAPTAVGVVGPVRGLPVVGRRCAAAAQAVHGSTVTWRGPPARAAV